MKTQLMKKYNNSLLASLVAKDRFEMRLAEAALVMTKKDKQAHSKLALREERTRYWFGVVHSLLMLVFFVLVIIGLAKWVLN